MKGILKMGYLYKIVSLTTTKKCGAADILLGIPTIVAALNQIKDTNLISQPIINYEIPKTIFDFTNDTSLSSWDPGYNWTGNQADMQVDNVEVKDGFLNININKEASTVDNQNYVYSGGEIQSKETYTGGDFDFLIKNGAKPGSAGSAFLITPWQEGNWYQKEIDIEFLGDKPNGVQFNFHSLHHGPNGEIINDIPNQGYKQFVELDFDTTKEFHKYSIKYDPLEKYIHFFVDGKEKYRIDNCDLVPNQNMEIRLNHWIPDNNPVWVGNINNDPNSPDYIENSAMQYKKIEVTKLEDIKRFDIEKEFSVIDSNIAIANSILHSSIFSLAGSFIGPFVGLVVRKTVFSVINLGRFLFGKKTINYDQKFKMPSAKYFGFAGSISAAIACAVKAGIVGSAFGPAGIALGIIAGLGAGVIAGFLGGYSGGFLVNKLIKQNHNPKNVLEKTVKSEKLCEKAA
jgi:beta-glucanase (GH16 family)